MSVYASHTSNLATCYFAIKGDTNPQIFGLDIEDRRKHVYIIGKTGMGKTSLLQNMILQDIYNNLGCCCIDPHGDMCQYILEHIPQHRHNDVIYFDPSDIEFPIGLNLLESQRNEPIFLIASSLLSVFKKIWAGMWSSRMEYILNNTLLALLENPENTLLGIIKMLTDQQFASDTAKKISDPIIKNFWIKEYPSFNERYRQEAVSPILNKIGQFLSNEAIRNIICQSKSTLDFREIMDNNKILLINLSKGRLGEDNSNLLGALLVAKLQIAAMSRVDIVEPNRKDFCLYVDEFQNFTTESFAGILSEARKYRLNLVLAHQYIEQLTESGNDKIKNAIFGNVGTIMAFRVGAKDADILTKEFGNQFTSRELINLERSQVVVKTVKQNQVLKPFIATTLPPIFNKMQVFSGNILDSSREKYTNTKTTVTDYIRKSFDHENTSNRNHKKKNNSTQNLLPKPSVLPIKELSEHVLEMKVMNNKPGMK